MISRPDRVPAPARVPDVRRMTVVRARVLGDTVLALPALAALRAAYADAELTVVGGPVAGALLDGRPGPWDRVVLAPAWPGLDADPGTGDPASWLAAQPRPDLAVQLHGGGAASGPLVHALGARVTAGAQDRGAPGYDRTVPYVRGRHEALRCLDVAGLVGAAAVPPVPVLAVTAADARAAADVLDGVTGRLVAVHPGASDARRCWPAERFAAVADALAAHGATVAVVGAGAADARAAARLRAAARRPVLDLVGRLDLPALVGVLARAELVVANDSGPRHLAAAVGTPTVGVWLAGNLATAGPLDVDRHAVAVSARTTCPVCGLAATPSGCGHAVSHVTDVQVGEVVGLALTWWGQAVAA